MLTFFGLKVNSAPSKELNIVRLPTVESVQSSL